MNPQTEAGWSVLPAFQGRGVATSALRWVIARIRAEGLRDLLVAYLGAGVLSARRSPR